MRLVSSCLALFAPAGSRRRDMTNDKTAMAAARADSQRHPAIPGSPTIIGVLEEEKRADVQSGILQTSTIDHLEYLSVNPPSSPEDSPPMGNNKALNASSDKSNKSRVSFSSPSPGGRASPRLHGAPFKGKVGTPTDLQIIDGGQELISRVYTSDNTKQHKKRPFWKG